MADKKCMGTAKSRQGSPAPFAFPYASPFRDSFLSFLSVFFVYGSAKRLVEFQRLQGASPSSVEMIAALKGSSTTPPSKASFQQISVRSIPAVCKEG